DQRDGARRVVPARAGVQPRLRQLPRAPRTVLCGQTRPGAVRRTRGGVAGGGPGRVRVVPGGGLAAPADRGVLRRPVARRRGVPAGRRRRRPALAVTRQRFAAGVALVATVLGAALIAAAVVAAPRLRLGGYVSEAGVGASGHATAYRWGAALLALGQAALAVALCGRLRWARLGVVAVTVGLVAVDAAFGGVSAAVSCSPGCPLPPYEPATPR